MTLIRPPAVWSSNSLNTSSLTPPLALAYLSATLREKKFSVTNIDAIGEGIQQVTSLKRNPHMEAHGLKVDQIIARIPATTGLIGVSCMFSVEWPATRDLIQEIRQYFPNTPIVIGGEHCTALPAFCLQDCPSVDYIICGEGDLLLPEFAQRIQDGMPVDDLPGIYQRTGNAIKSGKGTPESPNFEGASGLRVKQLDKLPWPAWDLTPLKVYLHHKLTFGRYVGLTMPMLGSRGCPHECTFCSNPAMWGRRYLTRSPKDVVDEIISYKNQYGISAIEFYDLTPIVRKSWILEFCDELIRNDVRISWQISGGTRCEGIDEEVVERAKKAGCAYIGFAPESGSQQVLDRIKKKIKLSHMLNVIRHCKKYGVDTRCNIIIGFPEDTRLQILTSLWFQFKLAMMGVVDSPIFEFVPYPGSELFDQLRREGVIHEINDQYLESLGRTTQSGKNKSYCRNIGPLELFFYRNFGMLIFYGLYYLIRPKKLFSFIRNIFDYQISNSVFEQRLIHHFRTQGRKAGLLK